MTEPHKSLDHKWHEDLFAFLVGAAMCALAVQFLSFAGLITGQTAGLGVLLSYVSDLSFGVWFFILNLPFYVFGWLRLGPRFTIKSFIAVAMVSAYAELLETYLVLEELPNWLAALLAGACSGLGLMIVFRHGASLGGIGVLALYLQDKTGWQAGWTQLGFDACLFLATIFILPIDLVFWSLIGAVATNIIIGLNHRKDRYVAR